MDQAIACGNCWWPFPREFWNRVEGARCPVCHQNVAIAAFPAIDRIRSGALPQALAAETEASCFYHPESRAAVACDECGRFLCGLCDLEIDGKHLCSICFQAGVSSSKLQNVETHRTMYDTIALAVAAFPLLLIWPAIVGAPVALFVVIRRWRAPLSVVPRTRVRFYLAALLALAELAGFGFLGWGIARLPRVGPS